MTVAPTLSPGGAVAGTPRSRTVRTSLRWTPVSMLTRLSVIGLPSSPKLSTATST